MPLDYDIVREKFEQLTERINRESGSSLTPYEVACGFINVANSAMARPIRALTEQRGFMTSDHNLSCFGGAGGQHATALAALLGMHVVIVHKYVLSKSIEDCADFRYSSVLSAYGMGLADLAVDVSEPLSGTLGDEILPKVQARFEALKKRANDDLLEQGAYEEQIADEFYLNLQYAGSDTTIMVQQPEDNDFAKAFAALHQREFAFTSDAPILIESVRVRATFQSESSQSTSASPYADELKALESMTVEDPRPFATNKVYFEQIGHQIDAPLYRLNDLIPGQTIHGPGIILDKTQTIVLDSTNVAKILKSHVVIDVGLGPKPKISTEKVDPIQLSIFSHRFMGIAEQMCRALQKTAVSVQIKERLEYV